MCEINDRNSLFEMNLKNSLFIEQCSSYINIGCYADVINNNKRDLNGLGLTNATNGVGSVESCISFCTSRGFLYAGLQSGWKRIFNFCLL